MLNKLRAYDQIKNINSLTNSSTSSISGLMFDVASVKGARITEGADYQGVRVKFLGRLGKSRIPIQLDIGFGDVVHPKPENRAFPVILNENDPPQLRMYPPETVVAEKFEAMVKNGLMNSRMKDFYDIWLLAKRFEFCPAKLCRLTKHGDQVGNFFQFLQLNWAKILTSDLIGQVQNPQPIKTQSVYL